MASISSLTIDKGPSRLRRWLRLMLWLAAGLLVLLFVAYLVVTSSGFIKRVVLPRVSQAIHAEVTVTDISLHPFSSIEVHGLKVQVKGQEPLVTVPEFRARYSLWSILRGNLRVSEVAVVSPTISLVENPDGTSNFGALLPGPAKAPAETTQPSAPAKSTSRVPQVDLQKITVSNATFRKIKNYPHNRRDDLEVTSASLTLANVKNGKSGTLQLGAFIETVNNPPTGQAGHLQASFNGDFKFTLDPDLKPAPVTGQTRLDVSRAEGVFGDFSGFSAVLDCNVTPDEIKQLELHFQKSGTSLGELGVSGPLDMKQMEGRLKVEVRGIDRRLLDLAGKSAGISFGATTISSSNDIELKRSGSVVSASGRFDAGNLSLTRAGQTTPTLNLNATYAVTVDTASQTAQLRGLNLAGTQNGRPLLTARLSQPMTVGWGKGATNQMGNSTLDLAVTGFNLADWKPFLGSTAAGILDVTLKFASQEDGQLLVYNLDSQFRNLAATGGANPTSGLSGSISTSGRIARKKDTQTVSGRFILAGLTGQLGQNRFRNFESVMDYDAALSAEQIQINKVNGKLTENGRAGGSFDLSGKVIPGNGSAQLAATLSGFNQDGLRPFLEPLFAGKTLASISVNGNASVQYDPRDSSDIKAAFQVANLVVTDPLRPAPPLALAANLQIDTALKKQSADIRQFQIALSPTKRAKNQLQFQGQVDFSRPNAIRGNLKLDADSLDVTSYYDLFAGKSNPGSQTAPAAAAPPAPAPVAEPPATTLPLKDFVVAADIKRFYLHEIEITGWQTTITVDGGHVLVKPVKLALNGAPVNAAVDLNLGVPGYRYEVSFGADRIPLAPIVDTFAPDRKGQIGGTFTSHVELKGAGITGANLQKNLAGQIGMGLTNLNLNVVNVRSPFLKAVINVVATIPELLLNPENAVASLMSQMTGSGGGLMGSLQKSPIEIINAQIKAGGGRVDLLQSSVQSEAFKADATGGISLATVLTNSTINIPVTVSVSQPVARQLNFPIGNTPTNAAYVPLPQFLTMKGTIGVPKADINKSALGGLVAKSIGTGLFGTATNGASNVKHFIGDLFKSLKPK